ncbi:MAG: lysylphosphatidylglycerol synthase transmembrane domain-containing protein [Pseudomonadota bacterium]
MSSKYLRRALQLVFVSLGAFIFISLVKKIGWQDILNNLLRLNWWFLPVFVLSFTWYWLYTKGWEQLLKPFSGTLSTFALFRAKVAGESINSLNPVNFMVGDPFRVYLLKRNFPVKEGAASVIVDRTIHSMSILFVILIGIAVGFPVLDFLPHNIQRGVPVFIIAMTILLALVLIFLRRGLFVLPFKLMLKLNIKIEFAHKTLLHMEELDEKIKSFYNINKGGFFIALIYHFVGRFLGIFEIFIFGHAITAEFTLRMAILLGALGPIVNACFAFLPGALGAMEGAYGGLLYILGLDPAVGVAIQIGRRIRAAFWTLVGIIFIKMHRHAVKVLNHSCAEVKSER